MRKGGGEGGVRGKRGGRGRKMGGGGRPGRKWGGGLSVRERVETKKKRGGARGA